MIYLILDILFSYISRVPIYFLLMNLVLIKKQDYPKLVLITLVLDLLVLNSYFLNTIILSGIFFLYKRLKISRVTLKNYLLSLILIYVLYVLGIGLINSYSFVYIFKFIGCNLGYQLIFYLLMYKIAYKNIILSR